MDNIFGTSPDSSALGDVLLLTSLCKHVESPIVELTPSANKRFGSLFNGIAKVIETNNPKITKDIGSGTFVERKLRSIGLENYDPLPKIKISKEEEDWARKIISQYKNPIIFVANTSKRHKHIRECNPEIWNTIIEEISKTRTIIQFGLSQNFTNFENTVVCKDLDIRKTAALYSIVKEYFGVDTGDMHLMLSVGGTVNVLVPRSNNEYNHECWHYKSPKAKYILFENYKNILNNII